MLSEVLVMGLNKVRIGDCVELYSEACGIPNLTIYDISGVNREKEFFSPSKSVGEDTSKYKIVPPGYFACNLMHVGRDVVLPIALNTTEQNIIVTAAYSVFKLIDETKIIKEYFLMFCKSPEKDRNFWFHTDSSVRDGMSWKDFCDITIELPPIQIQRKFVAVYESMVENQKAYEQGLEDLKLTCEAEINEIKHTAQRVTTKELLREVDNRNTDEAIKEIHGINITKSFMPSVASVNEGSIKNYKLVKNGQFAYSSMQTGRDECIRIALYDGEMPIIVSPAYSVLEVKSDKAVAEYIMLWFSRKEIDRYGAFCSDASIRANLDLKRFYEFEIPLPSVGKQKAIAKIYKAYTMRKEINEQLKAQIKDICPILIKGSLEEARA